MQSLPNDLIPIIFGYIQKITDKRQFAKTCVLYNNITKLQIKNVNIKIKIKYNYYPDFEYKQNIYCVENFMIELCHDSYFDLIPTKYITCKNIMVVRASIVYNNIKLLRVAINNGCEINGRDCCIAIEYDRLDILKLLIQYGAKWDYTYGTLAGERGHLDILIWLKENNLYLKLDNICYYATENGHLNIVKWCVNNGSGLFTHSCSCAAKYGHLNIVKWLIKNGAKLENTYGVAKKHKQHHIVEWLENNNHV